MLSIQFSDYGGQDEHSVSAEYNDDTSESADSFSQTAEIILPPQFPNDPPVLK